MSTGPNAAAIKKFIQDLELPAIDNWGVKEVVEIFLPGIGLDTPSCKEIFHKHRINGAVLLHMTKPDIDVSPHPPTLTHAHAHTRTHARAHAHTRTHACTSPLPLFCRVPLCPIALALALTPLSPQLVNRAHLLTLGGGAWSGACAADTDLQDLGLSLNGIDPMPAPTLGSGQNLLTLGDRVYVWDLIQILQHKQRRIDRNKVRAALRMVVSPPSVPRD